MGREFVVNQGGMYCGLGLEGISISPATPEQLDMGK